MRKTLFHIVAVATLGLTSAGFLNAGTINANDDDDDDDDYKTKTYEVGEISSIDANGLFSVVYEQTSGPPKSRSRPRTKCSSAWR